MIFKRFIRKKQTIIYIALFVLITSTMVIFNSYVSHINNMVNNYFKDNSYAVVISNKDKNFLLNKYSSIEKIYDQYIVLEPNENEKNPLSKRGYVLEDNNGILNQKESDDKISWDNFESVGKILISYDTTLKNNEIVLYSPYTLETEKVKSIINSKLYLKNDNSSYDFTIKSIIKSNFPEMRISKNLYDSIRKKQDFNVYRITFNTEKNLNLFYDIENENRENVFMDVSIQNNSKFNNYKEIISVFNNWKYIIFILIITISFIIISNLINDDKKNIMLDYVLGFKIKKIKFNMFINSILFCLIVVSFSFCLCNFTNYITISYFSFQIQKYLITTYVLIYLLMFLVKIISIKVQI